MGKTKCPSQEMQENGKQAKTGIVVWSPLNDKFLVPNAKPKCTWHKDIDSGTSPHTFKDWRLKTKILPDILTAIGNTPLVKLNKIPQSAGLKCNVYVKCEFFNPGGSVKDRIGYRMIEDAEKQGILKPGYTIIEPSSGNTGIGLALAAAVKGYRCIVVLSEKMSNEKVSVLKALGAETVRTPMNADSTSPDGMFGVTHRLKKEIPNSVILDQYTHPGNPLAHYDTTSEEILDQCDGKVDMLVIGGGTGGTICGVGKKFKEVSRNTVIVGVDPLGSILAQPESLNETDVSFYEVEGIGYDFIPTVLNRSVVDVWVKTSDNESLPMARRLIREEGLLCGSSSGAAVTAALQAAKDLKEGQNVVVILPDGIRNYITKFISDPWMEARHFKKAENIHNHWWWDIPVSTLNLPQIQVISASTTCGEAINSFKSFGIDQLPVVDNNGFMVGMITLQSLLTKINSGSVSFSDRIDKIVARVYPKASRTTNLGLLSRILEAEQYVVILETTESADNVKLDKPVALFTAIDLLQYTSKNSENK